MNVLIGPKEMRVEVEGLTRFPLTIRPAVRHYDMSEAFDDLRERVALMLPDHLLDVPGIRRAYRTVRRVGLFIDRVLFEGDYEREVHWVIGTVIVAVALFVAVEVAR